MAAVTRRSNMLKSTRGPARNLLWTNLANAHSAVGRHGANPRTAISELRRDAATEASLNGDGEIDVHAAVHGPGLQLGVVAARNIQHDAAVRGLEIEVISRPGGAGQCCRHAAVGRFGAHVTAHVPLRDAAIHGAQLHASLDVGHRYAAIMRFGLEVHPAGHPHLVTHIPALIPAVAGTFRMHALTARLDSDLLRERLRLRSGIRVRLDEGTHQDVAAIGAEEANASVLERVDVHALTRRHAHVSEDRKST